MEGQIGEITSRVAQARLRIGESELQILDLRASAFSC